jgi:hypothetical protein
MFKEIHHLKRVNKNTTGQTEIVLQSMRRIWRPTCIYQERETKKKKKPRIQRENWSPKSRKRYFCLLDRVTRVMYWAKNNTTVTTKTSLQAWNQAMPVGLLDPLQPPQASVFLPRCRFRGAGLAFTWARTGPINVQTSLLACTLEFNYVNNQSILAANQLKVCSKQQRNTYL